MVRSPSGVSRFPYPSPLGRKPADKAGDKGTPSVRASGPPERTKTKPGA